MGAVTSLKTYAHDGVVYYEVELELDGERRSTSYAAEELAAGQLETGVLNLLTQLARQIRGTNG